jgi:acetyl-CoA synthetase
VPTDVVIDGQYNIGHICTKQQCEMGRADKPAMRWLPPNLQSGVVTFGDLDAQSSKFANALLALGFDAGDVGFTFLPKLPEQFFAFLGILKVRGIAGTLFSNFGEEALLDRLGDARAKVLVTKRSLLKRIVKLRSRLPALRHIIVTDLERDEGNGVLSYQSFVRDASPVFQAARTAPETPSVIHYTSGSTGKPKGVMIEHHSLVNKLNWMQKT